MAERTSAIPQSHDPDFVDDLIRQLQIVGKVGLLNVSDVISPVYLLGQTQALSFQLRDVCYTVGEHFSAGLLINPAANTILADTTALPAGEYDVLMTFGMGNVANLVIEHRDAANAATLADWYVGGTIGMTQLKICKAMAFNERLRVFNVAAPGAGVGLQATIEAQAR